VERSSEAEVQNGEGRRSSCDSRKKAKTFGNIAGLTRDREYAITCQAGFFGEFLTPLRASEKFPEFLYIESRILDDAKEQAALEVFPMQGDGDSYFSLPVQHGQMASDLSTLLKARPAECPHDLHRFQRRESHPMRA
jgi:hypothetical protein